MFEIAENSKISPSKKYWVNLIPTVFTSVLSLVSLERKYINFFTVIDISFLVQISQNPNFVFQLCHAHAMIRISAKAQAYCSQLCEKDKTFAMYLMHL